MTGCVYVLVITVVMVIGCILRMRSAENKKETFCIWALCWQLSIIFAAAVKYLCS